MLSSVSEIMFLFCLETWIKWWRWVEETFYYFVRLFWKQSFGFDAITKTVNANIWGKKKLLQIKWHDNDLQVFHKHG